MFYILISSVFEILNNIFFLLGYISNVNSFPQPLSPEEEQHYLDLLKKGDEEARNILIERNLRLVAHIVKKYSSTINDSDDLISIGTIGLIKAISTFNHEKGTRLATYAARCIENEILMHIRSNKKTQSEVSLQDPIGVDRDGNEIALIDVIGNESESVVEEVELKMQVKRLYNKMKDVLKAREKMVLELRYGLLNGTGKTQREIAKMLGISRSYVSRIEKKAIKKLGKELKSESFK
ncbi:MAG TPA: RNA polymerase sporulation sigma factor SigK [Hungateiclostridium thermocellum]|uniref:RNA polymerase sigma factor n=2 Tax=Acetivibrio thermocellus TaxID=1515 RepID=A3DE65_ACET2|nr:RNA polymerase sporulation sigma factor SigK [Acetivibrio thermocellus]CDG35706.1 RNA polymerase sigma-28 factor [Acetivibrio thermocellus BC1]ABN52244.1 RNA polymerase, sigma 28 subunit, FliA/WhiG subfamily [Acetivibrio thermocellus ATCC 27405]ADU74267.1 RNA polymerase, sigma 28 subunit, SigK [Acetivibrio thermocellus DSM 1313]ALX08209.1 RNA polymerase, sigma 28 subunit, SigK [Acetivibrio thermocellus AD2]ANV75957.1 RNA polymerase, sigma 28 subunit, SigK [Acetivibrio thermocellus DSM 2360]